MLKGLEKRSTRSRGGKRGPPKVEGGMVMMITVSWGGFRGICRRAGGSRENVLENVTKYY